MRRWQAYRAPARHREKRARSDDPPSSDRAAAHREADR